MTPQLTPSQTVGPYFHIGLADVEPAVADDGNGDNVHVDGTLFDARGRPVDDGLIEMWHADASGRYDDERGHFGRVATDNEGRFELTTIKPGRVQAPSGVLQAPHLELSIFARGLLNRLVTRLYFPDEPTNAEDPVLQLIEPARRSTLVAVSDGTALRFDIHLSGERETVFFVV